jgi:hypothetical protein
MLEPVVIRAPGFGGLDLEGEDVVEGATFAKVAKNLVFDKAGRLASREGYLKINDLDGTDDVLSIFMYDYSAGDLIIAALADHIFEEATDRQGALAHTTAQWQFQNFVDKVVGAQQSQTMIVKSGAGNFAAIAPKGGGTVDATGNCVHSAFGRLWATDTNATTLYYCGLLDETEWPSATTPGDSGSVNILGNEAAVRDGYDRIVAINHLDNKLVVFLENSIVIFSSPDDPANLAIYKTLANVGCIARDSVQQVGNDLVFLSRDGVRSLRRAAIEDNFPVFDLSARVRSALLADISGTPALTKAAYYPDEAIYIMLTTDGIAWVFDFKRIREDGLPRVTTWDVPTWHSLYYHESILYIGQEGEYGKYSGYLEDTAAYPAEYKSLNVDFGSPNLKVLKKTVASMTGANGQTVQFTYDWDYGQSLHYSSASLPTGSTAAVYGTDNYGTGIYGDGISRGDIQVNPFGSGEVLSFGFTTDVSSIQFSLEQMSHFAKLGRIAR